VPVAVEQIDMTWDTSEQKFAISFFAEEATSYQIETSPSLEIDSWLPSGPQIEGNGESVTTARSMSGDATFFRVRTLP
jgi:hypothetical protein